MSSAVRRAAATVAVVVALLVLIGATYQGVATSLERHRFQRPGGLVDVGGFQLHILCLGQGSPTVVLEASAGSMSPEWGWVQPEVARLTRVCSYDRAGLGWSEARDGRYMPDSVTEDLHTLLREANEKGPFVMVGHELGAAFALIFASQYPRETAALVLVDDPASRDDASMETAVVGAWPWLARTGVLRASGRLSAHADGLPGMAGGAMRAFLNRPDHLTRAAMEISRIEEVNDRAAAVRLDPAIPVTAVTLNVGTRPAILASKEDGSKVAKVIEATVTSLGRHSN